MSLECFQYDVMKTAKIMASKNDGNFILRCGVQTEHTSHAECRFMGDEVTGVSTVESGWYGSLTAS